MSEDKNFPGFVAPTSNFYKTPNIWIDICAEINNLSELKVVQYVLRHTWGYQEYDITKTITIDEFMYGRKRADGTRMDKGTGLSKQSVVDGTRKAIEDGYLVCQIDDSDRARVKKSYVLNMKNGCQDSRHPVSKTSTSSVKNPDIRGLNNRQRSEKDTKRKTPFKDTMRKKGTNTPQSTESQQDQHPTEDSLALTQFFIAFDNFYRSKEGYIEHFMLPRNEKNKEAIKQLIEMGSTHEQALFVLEDIWNDPDSWWKKNRTISSVVSQFTTRIVKMPKTSKQNSQSATKKTAGMSEAEAVQLAEDIMQIAHITHYDIQAQAAPTKNSAMWIVQAVLPDGPGTIRSRSQWNTFWETEQQSVQMEGVR